jgi:two-component system probable response regulator PhcQ
MTKNNSKSDILIVDDEAKVIASLKRILRTEPYQVYSAENALKAMEVLNAHPIEVVISDERMPGILGSEFLSVVARRFPNVVRIMLTGHASLDTAMKAIMRARFSGSSANHAMTRTSNWPSGMPLKSII